MISIDPGESCYWAKWSDDLVACGEWPCFDIDVNEHAVIESQEIVKGFTKNPASIITLAHRAGAVASTFGWPELPDSVRWVLPQSWKRSTKKPLTAAEWASYVIHRKVVQALSKSELAIYTVALAQLPAYKRHNLADAVGLGLWARNCL